ncbi:MULTISPECIES: 16S rRNA (guanine(966)-N(2))-methyltransferase RsmD [Mycoplasma mycoides group]|nr:MULTISPECIES: 16S rRNA (guanine(966)-N(2))-methyltransferase RsmD [Mycoplasma mycoides group]QVK07055.1 16S rRNA (guanine(966)-N(2))-methyltransferase RsmD [Mycoplasma mycoides subsp. capri]
MIGVIMHIISGKYKKMKLQTLDSSITRPTLTRIKEDMFNIISNYFIFENKTSLDLFGGSGSLSIEGLSRGIKFAIINDLNKDANKIISFNLKKIPTSDYVLYQKDYLELLNLLKIQHQKVDLVYLDPPFKQIDYYYVVFDFLINNNLLNDWAIIISETNKQLDLTKIKDLSLLKFKDYNKKYLYIFRLEK